MIDFEKKWLQQPNPDLSCDAMMLRAAKSGRTAKQIRSLLKTEGFTGRQIAESVDRLSQGQGRA
jgi:ATPase subunit of ABC transporter with duplicated ATPase domains